ncbi:3'(2'),5'-bisphosphate nucleotidase CysQ [Limoniibacter endophyticus]|uniref:3'(2'),5'-bisphosphate nucleotidase CysQ n=1 Tax=Limoniibacter endophyticus TaxID=1565040 RepID=A0A8J3DGJ8_9HYPH|nr:3'(2'),5'-bisphosphate nucleotidase CysQ [Limoniibacter endophyticus]GHC67930.1 3'(2'),5'-bisphosphate nucleotidase CysQ [Limoniibacter endophyticus]
MPESDISDLALIRDAAAEAGRIALKFFGMEPQVWMKAGVSPVSEADYAADTYLRERLLAARPGYGWLSEETADSPERLKARRTFVVDPIDGTRGFLSGGDEWCVSVAVVENGRPVVGVLDCPAKNEIYWAEEGKGAFLNGKTISVRHPAETLDIAGLKATIKTLPVDIRARVQEFRHVPSLAYRLAMVARGAIDATFVKANSHDWDLAAADLILREAGGAVIDPWGEPLALAGADPRHGALAAGSGELLEEMRKVLSHGNA